MLALVAKKKAPTLPVLARAGAGLLSCSDFWQTLIEVVGVELAWALLSRKVVWV